MAKSGATRIFENLIKVEDIDVNHQTIVTFTFFFIATFTFYF